MADAELGPAGALAGEPAWPGWPASAGGLSRPYRPPDAGMPWRLDFHHPRGVVPLGVDLLDAMTAASQSAAHRWGLGAGFTARLVGPHVYFGPASGAAPEDHSWMGDAAVVGPLRGYAGRFRREWAEDAGRLRAGLRPLEAATVPGLAAAGLPELRAYLERARTLHRQAWQVHFDTMYPLLGLLRLFLAECAEVGVEPAQAAALLQGEASAVSVADQQLRDLVALARSEGLDTVARDGGVAGLTEVLRAGSHAGAWPQALAGFVAGHGYRGQSGADLATPGWVEDAAPLLALVQQMLADPPVAAHPPEPATLRAERIAAGLAPAARARFRTALGVAREANFSWWNEDHNVVIDLRAHLPVRAAALAAGALLATTPADAPLYLHRAELDDVLAGRAGWSELAGVAAQRREYVARWQPLRRGLPSTLGRSVAVRDLVLREILGADRLGGDGDRGGGAFGPMLRLHGLGVSLGVARGSARVLADVSGLAEVRAGEVLVCEATSPAWTPVFDRIAGCVCDQGGMLTHAAIIARELGVPAVCGVQRGTSTIRTGDLVEVDGEAGLVRVWPAAAQSRPPQ